MTIQNQMPIMNKLRLTFLLLTPLMWTGCSSTLPETRTYILPTPAIATGEKAEAAVSVSIESVKLADFLTQRGLVIEEGQHRVVITRYHRWAESLEDGIHRCLFRDLDRLGRNFRVSDLRKSGDLTQDYQLDFEFDSFHAVGFDTAIASGRWVLRDFQTRSVIKEAYFDLSTPVRPQNYEGIVGSLATLLEELAQEVNHHIEAISETE